MSIGTERKAAKEAAEAKTRPAFITDEHLEYLDNLRETGRTNMLSAQPFVALTFPDLSDEQSAAVLSYWMKSFGKANR